MHPLPYFTYSTEATAQLIPTNKCSLFGGLHCVLLVCHQAEVEQFLLKKNYNCPELPLCGVYLICHFI